MKKTTRTPDQASTVTHAPRKLHTRGPKPMALEQRFMFDGAAMGDALQVMDRADITFKASTAREFGDTSSRASALIQPQTRAVLPATIAREAGAPTSRLFDIQSTTGTDLPSLEQAQAKAETLLRDFMGSADARATLYTLLHGQESNTEPSVEWQAAFNRLVASIEQGDLSVRVELRTGDELQGAKGAFSSTGTTSEPTIYLNADWLRAGADVDSIQSVLVEEVGHAFDYLLNAGQDTAGDEGQAFESLLINGQIDLGAWSVAGAPSEGTLMLDGVAMEAEFANYTFTGAYRMVYDLNNNGIIEGNRGETAAEKEQSTHNFDASLLGQVTVNDGSAFREFSGNDVSATAINIGGTDYYGWISRPIKSNGIVRGFYFWTDPQFTSLALAQADGNQDGDANANDNIGFLLVVDQTWFSEQVTSTGRTVTLNNAKDGNLGAVNVATIGSSSDRVDTALNALLAPPNRPPSAVIDNANGTPGTSGGAALEAGGIRVNATAGQDATGNVLANDTDPDTSDTKAVTKVGTSTAGTTVAASSTSASGGTAVTGLYGTLTIGADGSYRYVVNQTNAAVEALRITSNTLVDSFTYTMADAAGLTSTTTLNITIQGTNDNPTAANDVNTAKESILSDTATNPAQYDSADPQGTTAVGNVLTNDSDVDGNSEAKSVVGSSISGSATGTSAGSGTSFTTLSFSTLPGNVSVGYYVFLDADNTANNNAGTLTALRDSANNQLLISSIDTTAKTFTLSGAVATPALSGTSILGFANKANGTGAYKDSQISSAPSSSSSTTVNLTGTITGTIAAGMTETSTNAKVLSVTYGAGGTPTAVTLAGSLTSFTNRALSFTGSASAGLSIQGNYGSLVLNADGSYTYTPTPNNPALSAGQSAIDVFNYTMQDAVSATSAATLTITVSGSGTNDPNATSDSVIGLEKGGTSNGTAGVDPQGNVLTGAITSPATGTGSADTTPAGTNNLVVSGVKTSGGTAATASGSTFTSTGLFGTLTLQSDGSYTYVIDNSAAAVQALRATSNTLTDTFIYTVKNNLNLTDTATLTVTIRGANDAPVAANDAGTATEASGLSNATSGFNPSGNVLSNDTDVDDAASALKVSAVRTGATEGGGTAGTVGSALTGQYGSLTLNTDGSWTYTVTNTNAAVNALKPGETLTDSFNYTVTDGSNTGSGNLSDTAALAITIQGANDKVSVNNVYVNEASPFMVFTVSGAAGVQTSLALGNSSGLASADAKATLTGTVADVGQQLQYWNGSAWTDYAGGLVTIPTGDKLLVRVAVNQDNLHEGNESLTLTATAADGDAAIGIGTINDEGDSNGKIFPNSNPDGSGNPPEDTTTTKDDDRPTISITSPSDTEGNDMVFTVSLDKLSTQAVSFRPTLASGTATIGTDTAAATALQVSTDGGTNWTTVNGAVTIAAGTSSVKLRLATVDDNTAEGSENFTLDTGIVSGPVKNPGGVVGTGTIIDNDGAPSFSVNDVTVNEGAGTATFTVTRSGASGSAVSVNFATSGGSATSGADFTATSGTLSFASGETTKTFTVPIIDDTLYEGNETFNVTLSSATGGATIADGTGIGTIIDNDPGTGPVTPAVNSIQVNEGSPFGVFTVTGTAGQAVSLALADGTAGSADYGPGLEVWSGTGWVPYTTGTVNLDANGKLLVRTPIKQDTVFEGSETFTLRATNTANVSGTGTATIYDDGTGDKFPDVSPGPDGTPPKTTGPGPGFDDDRGVSVDSIRVNEGSPFGVFTVTGTAGQGVTLALADGTAGSADYGSSLEVWNGTRWVEYTPGSTVTLDANGKLLVRTPIKQDTVFEGAETFTLTASVPGGRSGAGTATILDDGTGDKFPDTSPGPDGTPPKGTGPFDDDRGVSVNSISVNEGSPFGVFTVTGTAGQGVTLALANGTAGSADYGPSLEVWNGSAWAPYTGGTVTFGAGGSLLVRTPIRQDAIFEGAETFTLAAAVPGGKSGTGVGIILDDGTGDKYPDAPPGPDGSPPKGPGPFDDDRPLSVNSVTVNEGSPFAVFTVSGAAGQQATLGLTNGTAGSADYGPALQVWNGSAWVAYTGGTVTLNASGKLLVRTPVMQDTVFEGAESFTLNAINGGGAVATGTGTIVDDGTGDKFPDAPPGTDGNPPKSTGPGPGFDDDRPLTVNSVTVNEASPYAVFTVSGAAGQAATLALADGTATGPDYGSSLEVWNGTAWVPYGSAVTLDSSGKLLVRTPIKQDTVFESSESFTLSATNTGGGSGVGTGTIKDDGTGDVFPDAKPGPDGNPPKDTTTVRDDDRPLAVSSPTVNEASPYAVFKITGGANQLVASLKLANGSATDPDYGPALEYFDGTSWKPLTGPVSLDAKGELLVRTPIKQDSTFEGPESFTLTATNTGGKGFSGTGTIVDDGTGDLFPDAKPGPDGNPAKDTTTVKDDDRPLTVSSPTVNEGSPYAVFKITGGANQIASLKLSDGSATGPDYGPALEYFDGTVWKPLTGPVPLDAKGELLVRTPIKQDATFEGSETFTLTATNTGGKGFNGTATILDDGTGDLFPDAKPGPDGNPAKDITTVKDDDRPLSVNSITVSEASPFAVFTVTGKSGQLVKLALESETAAVGTDTGTLLQVFDGKVWRDYVPGSFVAIPPGGNTLLVRVAVVNDTLFEGPETFKLKATNTGGTPASGTATVVDDGSSGNVFPSDATSGTPTAGISDDDRPKPPPAPAPAPAPAAPAAEVALPPAPAPAPAPVPQFDSAVSLTKPSSLPLPDRPPIGDILTSASGFRVQVIQSEAPALMRDKGITDQFVEPNRTTTFNLPSDAFAHTRPEAVLTVTAQLTNGQPLPNWVLFNAQAGTFLVTPPPGFTGELEVQVLVRDADGREATANFKFNVGTGTTPDTRTPAGQQPAPRPQGRLGVTDQIRLAGQSRHGLMADWLRSNSDGLSKASQPGAGPADAASTETRTLLQRVMSSRAVQERLQEERAIAEGVKRAQPSVAPGPKA